MKFSNRIMYSLKFLRYLPICFVLLEASLPYSMADEEPRAIQVYKSDGSFARNCLAIHATLRDRPVVYGKSPDKLEIGGVGSSLKLSPRMTLNETKAFDTEVIEEGLIPISKESAFLIFSEDGQEVAFVPFNHRGTVSLRRCATVELNAEHLTATDGYTAFITWKNCLAGPYTLLESSKPEDPKSPELDWRFQTFFAYSIKVEIRPGERSKLIVPPGEIEVAILSKEQSEKLFQFGKDSNTKTEFMDPESEWAHLPANNGIHSVVSGGKTEIALFEGTCISGQIRGEDNELPNWDDSGLSNASVYMRDVRYRWQSFLPDYDIVGKGVDHYYRTLNSDAGRHWRSIGSNTPIVFVQANGKFMTSPIGKGYFSASLYQPDRKNERVRLAPSSDQHPGQGMSIRSNLIELLKLGAYYGDFESAAKTSARLTSLLATSGPNSSSRQTWDKVKSLLEDRSQLNMIYRSRDINERLQYNRLAYEFLFDVAAMFLELEELNQPEQILKNASRFQDQWDNTSLKSDLLLQSLKQKRIAFLHGKLEFDIPGLIEVTGSKGAFQDLGNLKPEWQRTESENKPVKFRPLQVMKFSKTIAKESAKDTQRGTVEHPSNDSTKPPRRASSQESDIKSTLHRRIAAEFDKKIQERESQLEQLETKLKAARVELESRKRNRNRLIEDRIKSLTNSRTESDSKD